MAIHYSLTAKKNRFKAMGEKLAYACAQSTGVVSLRDFSKHIAQHGSVFDRSVVEGVLIKAVQCMREHLLAGHIISLGDLGRFRVGLKSEGVEDANNFTSANIKSVRVVWTPGPDFRDLKDDASFTFVTTLKKQAEDKKAEKEQLNTALVEADGASNSSGSSNPSGSGDSGVVPGGGNAGGSGNVGGGAVADGE